MWMPAQMHLWLSQVLKLSLFTDLRDICCHFRCSQGQLILRMGLCRGPTWDQSRLEQQKKMWHFRASQVALEPQWWHQNCTIYNRVTLTPTDFHGVNSRAICPAEDSNRLGRDVLYKTCNTKLENYRGIGEQWPSNKKQPDFHATECDSPISLH